MLILAVNYECIKMTSVFDTSTHPPFMTMSLKFTVFFEGSPKLKDKQSFSPFTKPWLKQTQNGQIAWQLY